MKMDLTNDDVDTINKSIYIYIYTHTHISKIHDLI